ncbi:MAG: AAA family ATPase, partial [Bacilli bacterium]
MYLKRIETLGFKSFADKTFIHFNEGVTGVVGPNGSGKSNVVDAVRWVLGEQSVKQLRGGTTMTDVIFSGSKSRSAHSYAYVTLVLD